MERAEVGDGRFWPNPAAHLGLYSMAAVHPKQTFAIRVLFIIYEQ